MINRRFFLILTLILISMLLTACWSSRPLEDIAIITSMGIDRIEEGYQLSLEVIVPGSIAGEQSSQKTPVEIVTTEGSSICEAFRRVSDRMARYPHLSHTNTVIISEEIAREGLAPVIDCLVRDDVFRFTTTLFIAKEQTAVDILRVSSAIEPVLGTKLRKLNEQSGKIYSINTDISIMKFVNFIVSDGQEALVPGVLTEGDPEEGEKTDNVEETRPNTYIKMTPPAVFKKDRLIGWLDEYLSKGTHLILNEVESTMIEYECDEGKYQAIEFMKGDIARNVKIKNDQPELTIEANIKAIICQSDCKVDLSKQKNIEKMQKNFEKVIQKQLEDTFSYAQTELKADIFGIGGLIHKQDPLFWKEIKDDWESYYENMKYKVKVSVTIEKTGSTKSPINMELEKR